ncbi:MAG: GT-D fold domain-containing glycosyltransferase [Bacteroides sp.]|nr:GT-D fold domain-containing glycosyltransferase [Bacteroides sp.]MCM1094718.1 GT-D fold domain-containing glycosyltransferase [Terasakiella sp.]
MGIAAHIYFIKQKLSFIASWPERRRVRVMSFDETIDYAVGTRCSISRYGDGELNFALASFSLKHFNPTSNFQDTDNTLCKRLAEILRNKDLEQSNLLVCVIGYPFSTGCKSILKPSKAFWYNVGSFFAHYIDILFDTARVYGEAAITRFYITQKNKADAPRRFARLKQLWQDDDLLIVEGEQSRLGVGNDVFDNARSIRRILCPATDAWSRYEDILDAVRRHVGKHDTVILALGQTATVMAYDLAREGHRALDLGHIDIEYEWMRMGATEKVPVPGKFTNEARGGNQVADVDNQLYESQILERIV